MSFFIIKLLSPTSFKSGIAFLETTISEFYNQESYNSNLNNFANRNETYCYTFNEHFSIHKNGQKELTFSMLKNIWLDDQLTVNPFLSSLHNGTQLLLIDKYNNEYFFTIKDIKLNFKNKNIVYDFSCQDSFTYQLIRQNEGYTIENDPSSEDFIGAKNIDWWVYNKIAHDCYIGYTYVPLFQGLYLDQNKNLHTFLRESELQNVEKIIKPIYDKNSYPEYYEEIPFSLSESNADSALITLGESLSLNLNFKENNIKKLVNGSIQRTTQFERYFWFEPVKNENPSGLTYSPYTSISSFDLNFAGDALTTVLNVESNTINDELITLIPEVPLFFKTLFTSKEWDHSKYTDGYFTSVCQGISYILENGNSSDNISCDTALSHRTAISNDNTYILEERDENRNLIKRTLKIKIYNINTTTFLLPNQYDLISFEKDEIISFLYINSTRITPHTTRWELEVNGIRYNNTFSPIPNNIQNTEQEIYIVIDLPTTDDYDFSQSYSIDNSKIILNFYRNVSTDELDFAEMADKCPWLENKIIDLSFFLTQNVIDRNEYDQIWNILRNDLRIVNGKLLLYSASYYEALHNKTETMANLINDLDSLGASFNADVISAYATKGVIDDIDIFSEAYKTIQSKYFSMTPTTILNYDELLTEYFNKYFKAQQCFLKNIYNFRKYFDTQIEWSGNSKLYQYTISINTENKTDNYVTLQNNQFIKIDNSFKLYNESSGEPFTQIFDKDKQTILDIVHENNYKNFFYPNEEKVSFSRNNGSIGYDPNKTYYRCLYRFKRSDFYKNGNKIKTPNMFIYKNELYTYHSSDEDYFYYGSTISDAVKETWDEEIIYKQDIEYKGEKTYKEVNINEIISEFLYNSYLWGESGLTFWFYHDTDNLSKINWINPDNKNEEEKFFNQFSPLLWLRCIYKELLKSTSPLYLTNNFLNGNIVNSDVMPYVKDFYYKNFPVKELKLIDQPKYLKNPFTFKWGEQTFSTSYQRVNEKNQTVQDYIDYWKNKQVGIDTEEVLNPTEYTQTYTIPLIIPSNENKYYRRTFGALNGGALNNSLLSFSSLNKSKDNISQILSSGSLTTWSKSGLCLQYASGNFFTPDRNTISGYIDKNQIVYTFSPEAYNLYIDLKKERETNDFIGKIIESNQVISPAKAPVIINNDNGKITYEYNKTTLATGNNNAYLISDPSGVERGKNYFDKYSLLGLTYRSALSEKNTKLKYKDEWLRPMLLTDPINKNAKYKILVQEIVREHSSPETRLVFSDNDLTNIVNFSNTNRYDPSNRFSKTIFYPILNSCEDVDLSTLEIPSSSTLGSLLNSLGWKDVTQNKYEYWIRGSYNQINFMFLFLEDEDFIRNSVLSEDKFNKFNNYSYLNNRYSVYKNKPIYDELNGITIDFLKQKDLLKGFYYIADKNDNFISCENIEWSELQDKHLYKKTNIGFERVYTLSQLIKRDVSSYYLGSIKYQFEEFQTNFKKPLKVFLHKNICDGGKIISSNTIQSREFYNFTIDEKLIGKPINDIISDGSDEYKINYTIERTELNDLSKMSNGQFWYLYHNKTNSPTLFQQAAVIETQLTTFWQQAYSNSLYCEYFIPEYWQPRINGSTNYFSNKIFTLDNDNNIKISNNILPSVTLVTENGKTLLPAYNIKYNSKINFSEDVIKQRIDRTNIRSLTSLMGNKSFEQIFNNLGESNSNNFLVEEIPSKKINYYSGEGGLKWKEIISKLSTYTYKYDLLDGLHIMTYKILKNSFCNKSFDMYEKLKEEHHQIWSNLYNRYSSILLENIYSNSDATTPQELYILASNFLKDKTEPEKGYSISIIDLDRLQGYIGEELLIGSSIKINSEDYIDDNSYIAKSISQYLFITDLSYDLRKSSDVEITVNSIKYQDKLIQRLVKLIK